MGQTVRASDFPTEIELVMRFSITAPDDIKDRVRRAALVNEFEDSFAGWVMFPSPDHVSPESSWAPAQGYTFEVSWPDLYGVQTIPEDVYDSGTQVLASEGDFQGTVWRKLDDFWEAVNPVLRPVWGPQKLSSLVQDGLGIVLAWQESR